MAHSSSLFALLVAAMAIVVLAADTPFDIQPSGQVYFFDGFNSASLSRKWVQSTDPKYGGKFTVSSPLAGPNPLDKGLLIPAPAQFYAIAGKLPEVFHFNKDNELVVQYEVKLQKGLDCGGAYLKLLAADAIPNDAALASFTDKTRYSIMFGPDKCGSDSKVHLILQVHSPITGQFEEKHLVSPAPVNNDNETHLYTLIMRPDNTFTVKIDQESVKSGSLLDADLFSPSVNPPATINDPDDKKPQDWIDNPDMPDPQAVKPDDWDEDQPEKIDDPQAVKPAEWDEEAPETIPDPSATKPTDWDDELDGEWAPAEVPNPKCEEGGCGKWAPPRIKNPLYKGKWNPPMIPNPDYKGQWAPRKIPNPLYYKEESPFSKLSPIGAIAIEIWTMSDGVLFDNILLAAEEAPAKQLAQEAWKPKSLFDQEQTRIARKALEKQYGNDLDGWKEWAADLWTQAVQLAQEQPLLVFGTFAAGVIPVLFLFCLKSSAGPVEEVATSPSTTTKPETEKAPVVAPKEVPKAKNTKEGKKKAKKDE